mgnify:CR=1 FL=1
MWKVLLVLIPVALIIGLVIALLFFIIPDYWVESLNDKNIFKRLMNNPYFQIIYIVTSLTVGVFIILGCVYFGCLLLGIQ